MLKMKSETVNIIKSGNLCYITFPKLSATGLINHAFTTRLGGVSEGFFSSMNMSFNRGEKRESTEENYRIICDEIGIDVKNLVFSKQTHTDNIKTVSVNDRGTGFLRPEFSDIDGLVTNCRKVALVTQYADCTPLLFCDPIKKVIASSHSGWRGTVKRIGAKTVEKMVSEFGCRREDIIAAIGPSIGGCCYEVDDVLFSAFSNENFDTGLYFSKKDNGKYMLDLKTVNKDILLKSGIKPQNLNVCDICTACNTDSLYSHRAMGNKRGNLAAIIELK